MRLALAIGALLVAAAPAPASTEITAGPVIAGDGAAWGERTAGGAVQVLTSRPGAEPVVARRWARPRHGDTDRTISALAAGARRGAAVLTTCTSVRRLVIDPCTGQAFTGPFARLRGPRPPQRVGRRCGSAARNAVEVAVGARWRATLVDRRCLGRYAGIAAAPLAIEARRGALTRTIAAPLGRGLRVAGRHLAWRNGNGGAVLYDLERGRRARLVGSRAGAIGDLDVQADGTLALTRIVGPNRVCVAILPPGGAERSLDCWLELPRASEAQADGGGIGGETVVPAVAIAAGRVLYARHQVLDGLRTTGPQLVVARAGGEPDVIARFPPALARVGGIDLGRHHAAWAQQRQHIPDVDGMPGRPEPRGRPVAVLRSL